MQTNSQKQGQGNNRIKGNDPHAEADDLLFDILRFT